MGGGRVGDLLGRLLEKHSDERWDVVCRRVKHMIDTRMCVGMTTMRQYFGTGQLVESDSGSG